MQDENVSPENVPSPEASPAPPTPVGMLLAQARVAHGWDVDEVDRITHISPGWVVSVENGDWKRYPSMVYARGHVRAYADALGLDVPIILGQFQKEWDAAVVPDASEPSLGHHGGGAFVGTAQRQKSALLLAIFAVLVAAVGVAFWYGISSRSNGVDDRTMVNPPPASIGKSSPAIPAVPPVPASAGKDLSAGKSVPVPPPPPAPTTLPAPLPSAPVSSPAPVPPAIPAAKDERTSPPQKPTLVVRMVAIKNNWVTVTVDNGPLHKFHLQPGEGRVFSGKSFLTFSTGAGNGLVVFVNGRRLGLAGNSDAPVYRRHLNRLSVQPGNHRPAALPKIPAPPVSGPSILPSGGGPTPHPSVSPGASLPGGTVNPVLPSHSLTGASAL